MGKNGSRFFLMVCQWGFGLGFVYFAWVVIGRPPLLKHWWIWVVFVVVPALHFEQTRKDLVAAWAKGKQGFFVRLLAGIAGVASAFVWEDGQTKLFQLAAQDEWLAFWFGIASFLVLGFSLIYWASVHTISLLREAIGEKNGYWWRVGAFFASAVIVLMPLTQLLIHASPRLSSLGRFVTCILATVVLRLMFEILLVPYRLARFYRHKKM